MQTVELPRAVSEDEAAAMLGVATRTLQDWRFRGRGPRYLKYEAAVRYRIADLKEWMEARVRTGTRDTSDAA